MTVAQYIEEVATKHQAGNATEHTFRGLLEQLIESIAPGIRATNEPKRQACGAPDYILTKNDIPIGFIEAKNIGDNDLEGAKKNGNKEQFDRYKAALGNLIFTDYIEFHLYRDGEFASKIAIAELGEKGIKALPENIPNFINLIKNFCAHSGQTLANPQKLAGMMAAKARLLADVMEKSLVSDEETRENSTLKEQLDAFKLVLIHDIEPRAFADVYAQTVVYGMFAARSHDPALAVFSRQKAAELIPKSNPFLRKLFSYIAGPEIDGRIKWIVDDLASIFLACDVADILKGYGKETQTEDPIIHFYETFLAEYDPKQRKARGVWYTPAPVVKFIVRAVDDILKTEFGLPDGLADISTVQPRANSVPGNAPIHKVQILDPATGTGTFLAETVKHIHKRFEGREGMWGPYVDNHLLPRLNGFELLMASYAMAHLKMDLLLAETGHKPANDQRFRIYLTNSLEESHPDTQTLFASWLSDEANEANRIKRDRPVMCVMGNPPYAVSSSNRGAWIQSLIADYKKGLNEKKLNLDDDYIKFIRLGQHFIDKNGCGVLAYISNNSFIDGITHRQMRKSLLESFDKIYILDLHGSAKKNETALDGGKDENVFDIQQGVSINIFVKTGLKNKSDLGQVFHLDLYGRRKEKYLTLANKRLDTIGFVEVKYEQPYCFFVPKQANDKNYDSWFSINELFVNVNNGIKTDRDSLFIAESKKEIENRFKTLLGGDLSRSFTEEYRVIDSGSFKITERIKFKKYNPDFISEILYRIFDTRYTYYDPKIVSRPAQKVMQHLLKENIAFLSCRQQSTFDFQHIFISKILTEGSAVSLQTKETTYVFPLYLYTETEHQPEHSEHLKNLEVMLEEAKMIAENFQKIFVKIQKMYAALPNPDAEIKKYYKEQEKAGAKLNEKTEKIKQQIAAFSAPAMFEEEKRKPNFDKEIIKKISDGLGLPFVAEKEEHSSFIIHHSFAPIDVFDYIYAVLHSPSYRAQYKEFLKIDFPRIPYPKNQEKFWRLVALGGQLRQIHLLESPALENILPLFPVKGGDEVEKPRYENGRVYINDAQYFDQVPQSVWEFYIGGYQPAQKWLKDRKGRALEYAELGHYQKLIAALSETERLMGEIGPVE